MLGEGLQPQKSLKQKRLCCSGGYGEGLLVGFKEVLTNHLMAQEWKAGLLAENYSTADLNCLFSVIWRSGTVPLEWQTGVMVPIFKNADWKVCSIVRVSHCSALLEGVCPSSFMCFVTTRRCTTVTLGEYCVGVQENGIQ